MQQTFKLFNSTSAFADMPTLPRGISVALLVSLIILTMFYIVNYKQRTSLTLHEETSIYIPVDIDTSKDFEQVLLNNTKAEIQNKNDFKHIPNTIVQYGETRTATTLQFEILCILMAIKREDEAANVACEFNKIPETKFKVVKTHNIMPLLGKVPDHSWLFMTSGNSNKRRDEELNRYKGIIKAKHIVVPYVADIKLVLERGYRIVHEYQNIFGLSDEQMEHVADYIQYWDILRICCGRQLSKSWREILYKRLQNGKIDSNTEEHYCAAHNITQVELSMMDSYIYKKFSNVASLDRAIGRPSVIDGRLDGTYCARCNKNIHDKKLKQNDPCG